MNILAVWCSIGRCTALVSFPKHENGHRYTKIAVIKSRPWDPFEKTGPSSDRKPYRCISDMEREVPRHELAIHERMHTRDLKF